MEKRFLVATDEAYYPSACFSSIKFKVNFGDEFTISKEDEFVEIYDKETDEVYSLKELFETNRVAYVGEVAIYPYGRKCEIEEEGVKYSLVNI